MSDSEQQDNKEQQQRIEEQGAKLNGPLYRLLVRDHIQVENQCDYYRTITVRHPKSVWKEPLVWLFIALNALWGFFCLIFSGGPFNQDNILVATLKFIGLIWMMGLPAVVAYIRELGRAKEAPCFADFFGVAIGVAILNCIIAFLILGTLLMFGCHGFLGMRW